MLAVNMTGTGFDGRPWPELWDGTPALVLPAGAVAPGPLPAADGWSDNPAALARPAPGWSATLDDQHITITAPDGSLWFDGAVALTRHWRRAAHHHGQAVLVTGPFTHPGELHRTAAHGGLRALTTRLHIPASHW